MENTILGIKDYSDQDIQELLRKIEVVADSTNTNPIYAFGSRVVGTFREHSDLDIGVFKDGKENAVLNNGSIFFKGVRVSIRTYVKIHDISEHTYHGYHLSMYDLRTRKLLPGKDDEEFYRIWPSMKMPNVKQFQTVDELNAHLNKGAT